MTQKVFLYKKDDLVTRAEKIVDMWGLKGAVGGYVINVYRILQKYTELDKENE